MKKHMISRRAAFTVAGAAAISTLATSPEANAKDVNVHSNLFIEGKARLEATEKAKPENKSYTAIRTIGWLAAIGLMVLEEKDSKAMNGVSAYLTKVLSDNVDTPPTGGWIHHVAYGFETGVKTCNHWNS